jgi:hypothetical protein
MLKRGFATFVVGAVSGFAVVLAGCSTKPNGGDGGTSSSSSGGTTTCQIAGGTTCQTVGDCANTTNFTCDSASNCCVFFCTAVKDCGSASLGDPNDPCTTSSLGCVCDQGVCKSKQCSADADCNSATLICKGGSCQAPDSATQAATILVQPNPAILHVGAAQQFTATVLDANGNAVILAAGGVTWKVSGNGTISATGSLTPTTASTTFGDTTITATAGTVTGTAIATVYAAPTALQVTLIDGAASVPVIDATVEYSDATGKVVGTPLTLGDALGRYALGAAPAGAALLNVFEPNYQYVSVDVTALPASNDVVLYLAQDVVNATVSGGPQPVVGGYTGDFQKQPGILDPSAGEPVSETGDIHVGIAGTAVPQDLLDISITALLGPSHDVTINIGGSHVVPLPQGIELGFGTTYFKCAYDGLGAAGGCGLPPCTASNTTGCLNNETDPTQADWPNSVFACGQRSAWGLGGGVPFSAISSELGALAGGNVSVATILTAVLPDFSGFNSGVYFQVPYTEQPPVPANQVDDACSGALFTDSTPIPNPASLTPATKVPLTLDTPLALQVQVTLPPLPSVGTGSSAACQSTALVLGGAIEPGYGLLPLGLSAGTILDANNNPSASCKTYDTNAANSTDADGNVIMAVAPEHGGVERDTYGVVALSLDVSSIAGGSSGPTAISGLVQTFPALPYGQSVTFPGVTGFPAYLQNATYNPNNRTFSNDTTNNTGATWERLRFQDDLGREWITYFAPGTASLVLPTPPTACGGTTGAPGACTDRTLTSTGSLASPEAQQVITTSMTTFSGFLDFTNGPIAASLIDTMIGFSAVGIACPSGVTGGGC